MKWIPVSSIPPFSIPILVTDGKWVLMARLDTITMSAETTNLSFLENESGYDNLWISPTHWMPLPEPPDETQEVNP